MFTILAIGTLKESYWREATAEYIKRLTPYVPLKIVEIKEVSFKSPPLQGGAKEVVLAGEAEKIIARIKPNAHVVLLTPEDKTPNTGSFAQRFEIWRQKGDVTFVLGGPLGTHRSLHMRANETLSLSPLTFTHQMTRVILLEQLYRVVMREKGKYDY